jgi:nicotinamide-nucleotide amidase
MMFSKSELSQALRLLALCRKRGVMVATAESCTGGLIAALLTEIPGSSDVFERGFVTYSNDAKHEQLGIKPSLLAKHGAVSAEVAGAMAEGALKHSKAKFSMAVTGVAGPGGGTPKKPVGLVYIAVSGGKGKTAVEEYRFKGSRSQIRMKTVAESLKLLTAQLTRFS